jgi:hypothetical protein
MAITKGTIVAQPSGAMGGIVFSHNRGGGYIRTRSIPTNPSSVFQQAVRNGMVVLSPRWGETLTAAQRAGWDVYAENVPIINRVGDPINIGGIGHYARSNVSRVQAGVGSFSIVDDAPTIFNLGTFTPPVFGPTNVSTQQLVLTFDNTDDWANEDESAMFVYLSAPQGPATNFFKGPYRLSASIAGDSVTPPTSPAQVPLPFAVVIGQKVFGQLRVSRADGRLTGPFRSFDIVVA